MDGVQTFGAEGPGDRHADDGCGMAARDADRARDSQAEPGVMSDLKALRELAEKASNACVLYPVDIAQSALHSSDARALLQLRDAVLALTEAEKPKEPRKFSGWLVVNDQCGVLCSYVVDIFHARQLVETYGCGRPCYVTGTEGVSPDDVPPQEQKQEKVREWWVVVDKDGIADGICEELSDARLVLSNCYRNAPYSIIRVREVKEGE